jgi:hypothetical protein
MTFFSIKEHKENKQHDIFVALLRILSLGMQSQLFAEKAGSGSAGHKTNFSLAPDSFKEMSSYSKMVLRFNGI